MNRPTLSFCYVKDGRCKWLGCNLMGVGNEQTVRDKCLRWGLVLRWRLYS